MERRIPTVFVTTHGAYPYIIKNNKIQRQYGIIPKDMTVYIVETAPLGVCNINTATDNDLIVDEINKYMKYDMNKENLIYKIVDIMDEAHGIYTEDHEELHNITAEDKKVDEKMIHSRETGKMYSLKRLVGGDLYADKIFSRDSNDIRSYKDNIYDMRINFMNLKINKIFEDIDNSTRFHVEDILGQDMDKEFYLSKIIKRIYYSGFKVLLIIDNSCSSFYNQGIKLDNEENLHKLYNDNELVWLNTNSLPNEDNNNKKRRLLHTIGDILNEEKSKKRKERKGGKRRKSKNHLRKITNRKTHKKRLDR